MAFNRTEINLTQLINADAIFLSKHILDSVRIYNAYCNYFLKVIKRKHVGVSYISMVILYPTQNCYYPHLTIVQFVPFVSYYLKSHTVFF